MAKRKRPKSKRSADDGPRRTELERRVLDTLCKYKEVPVPNLDAASIGMLELRADLGLDSLDVITIVWELEEELEHDLIDEDELAEAKTIADLAELLS